MLYDVVVSRGQAMIRSFSSWRQIRLRGSHSNTRRKMPFSSGEMGRMVLRKFESLRNARKVESSGEAFFHGFRPQVRFTKITPRLHTSLGAVAYRAKGWFCPHSGDM